MAEIEYHSPVIHRSFFSQLHTGISNCLWPCLLFWRSQNEANTQQFKTYHKPSQNVIHMSVKYVFITNVKSHAHVCWWFCYIKLFWMSSRHDCPRHQSGGYHYTHAMKTIIFPPAFMLSVNNAQPHECYDVTTLTTRITTWELGYGCQHPVSVWDKLPLDDHELMHKGWWWWCPPDNQ